MVRVMEYEEYKRPYRLPLNAGYTRDLDEYLNAWKELAAPIERYFGGKLSAFDPGLRFTSDSWLPFDQISTWEAKELGKLIKFMEEHSDE